MKSKDCDNNIIECLHKIKTPFVTSDGHKVKFADRTRNESTIEHIANKKHKLSVRDIENLISIINKPFCTFKSKKNKNNLIFYGKRKGVNKKHLIKIIIRITKNNEFEIVTVYPVKKIGEK